MNYEKQRSNIYKELHPKFWDNLLTETPYAIISGLIVAGIILAIVLIGH